VTRRDLFRGTLDALAAAGLASITRWLPLPEAVTIVPKILYAKIEIPQTVIEAQAADHSAFMDAILPILEGRNFIISRMRESHASMSG
jgi:hypothetical protein